MFNTESNVSGLSSAKVLNNLCDQSWRMIYANSKMISIHYMNSRAQMMEKHEKISKLVKLLPASFVLSCTTNAIVCRIGVYLKLRVTDDQNQESSTRVQ